jgi:branched-chain amino acid transport system ATP-binding protein
MAFKDKIKNYFKYHFKKAPKHKRANIKSDYVLETKDLGISFGGLKAAQNVNIKIEKNQIYGLIGPNGAGKTTVFNLLTGVYQPTTGSFYLNGEDLTGLRQDIINKKGFARTFQNIRLFNNMTVVRNVMVGLANQPEYKCTLFESISAYQDTLR